MNDLDEMMEAYYDIDKYNNSRIVFEKASAFFNNVYEMNWFIIENVSYYSFLKQAEYIVLSPYRTASTYTFKVLNENGFKCNKIHHDKPSINGRELFLQKTNKVEADKLSAIYPYETEFSEKLKIIEACYMYWLHENIDKIKNIYTIVRDPIEVLLSNKNYIDYYGLPKYDNDRLDKSIRYDAWYDRTFIKEIDGAIDKVTFIKSTELNDFLNQEHGIVFNGKLNNLNNKEYTQMKILKFSDDFLDKIYDSFIFKKVYSENEIENLKNKWRS